MNLTVFKRFFSIFLTLVMVLSLLPASVLTAFAASPTEITELSFSFRGASGIPVVGDIIQVRSAGAVTENDDRIEMTASGLLWCFDDSSVVINDTFDDHGVYFEAGRSYNTEFAFEVLEPDKYCVTENTVITFTNPGDFTYTAKLDSIVNTGNGVYAHIRLTITMNGQRTYPDISKVVFKDFTAPSQGLSTTACGTDIYKNNCYVSFSTWLGDVWEKNQYGNSTFVAGEIYTYKITLTAQDGYKFDENATVILTNAGTLKAPANYAYSNDKKTLTLNYSYSVQGLTYLDGVEASVVRRYDTITPIAGESATYLASSPYDAFEADENEPYEIVGVAYEPWYDEYGNELDRNDRFEARKTYYFEIAYSIKEELEHLYRFSPDHLTTTITGDSYTGKGFQKAERVEYDNHDNTYVKFRYYFTAQLSKDVGQTANNPAVCNSYAEFKYAMENEDIRYVALGNINETMPVGEEGLVTAIHVKGIKNLTLLGNATFTAPAMTATTYAALLHTTQNTSLNISGSGSLTFKAVANNSYNAVIYNQGGSVNISSGTLIGSYNTAVYGKAIWQDYGELRISGGQFFAYNALAPLSLPRAADAVFLNGGQTWIQGGTFKTTNVIDTIDLPYGLSIGQYATVDLSGGTFYGIELPTSSTPLANYMDEDFYTPLTNESKFNPNSQYSQEYTASGKVVRIAWLIDHVDVHINSPIAGVDIAENYFNIPTSGCQATMYYPQWYKNGVPVTYGTFEAGASYKVVVQIDAKANYGAEFGKNVTAAINNKSVAVDRKSAHWIEIAYDFGTCPATVGEVKLTTTAPKEGSIPATVTRGNSTYSVNDTQWWVSNTGEDGTWSVMGKNTKYAAGKYYKLSVDLKAANGYRFVTDENLDPDVFATVNGYTAKVSRVYEQAAAEFIHVEYYFGYCNKTTIESVIIENIAAPVMGEYPSFTCAYVGTGYGYYTDMDNGTITKNGIKWFDITGGSKSTVWYNDTFTAGHSYQVEITARVQDGFNFANSVFATVNGDGNVTATVNNGIWCTITYTFTCQPKTLTAIAVTGLDRPVDGAHPDFSAITDSEYYTVEEIVWYDYENGMEEMTSTDTFAVGNRYYLMLTVVPTKTGSANNAKFVSGKTTAKLNGITVKKVVGDSWQEVSATSKAVTIFYTFENTPYADDPFNVKGDLDGNGVVDEDDAVYLLQHILMPEFFPVSQPVNFDGIGDVDEDDAIYLLQHVLMPEFFPL